MVFLEKEAHSLTKSYPLEIELLYTCAMEKFLEQETPFLDALDKHGLPRRESFAPVIVE